MAGRDGWFDWFRLLGGLLLLCALAYVSCLLVANAYLALEGHIF